MSTLVKLFDRALLKEIFMFYLLYAHVCTVYVSMCVHVPPQACDMSRQGAVRRRAEREGRISDYEVWQLVCEQTEL